MRERSAASSSSVDFVLVLLGIRRTYALNSPDALDFVGR
jgi:hypothetical protein